MSDRATIPWEQTAAAWDAASAGYAEHIGPRNARFAEDLIGVLAPAPGKRFLDVACGSGVVATRAARRGCKVVAIDFSARMVQQLAADAARLGLALEARQMDGQHLDFADASFDFAASLFGVSLFLDRAAGLREMRRVLAPDGRAAIGAWLGPERVEILTPFWRALNSVLGTPPPLAEPPLIYRMADENAFRTEVLVAGFRDVAFYEFDHPLEFRDSQEYWRLLESAVPASLEHLNRLPETARRAVRAALDDDVRESFGTAPLSLAASARIAIALA
jgi:SAM-dependent methyltransferase